MPPPPSQQVSSNALNRRKLLAGGAVATVAWSAPTVSLLAQVSPCAGSAVSTETLTPIEGPSNALDSWRSNLVVDEVEQYVNTSGVTQQIHPTDVRYESGRAGILMTPFFVRILGDNSFVVLAIGDSVLSPAVGNVSRPFSQTPQCFDLEPGWVLGIGFLDANADGSNSVHSVVRWFNGGNEIWYSGGPGATQSASVVVGLAPIPGPRVLTQLRRNYMIDYRFEVTS